MTWEIRRAHLLGSPGVMGVGGRSTPAWATTTRGPAPRRPRHQPLVVLLTVALIAVPQARLHLCHGLRSRRPTWSSSNITWPCSRLAVHPRRFINSQSRSSSSPCCSGSFFANGCSTTPATRPTRRSPSRWKPCRHGHERPSRPPSAELAHRRGSRRCRTSSSWVGLVLRDIVIGPLIARAIAAWVPRRLAVLPHRQRDVCQIQVRSSGPRHAGAASCVDQQRPARSGAQEHWDQLRWSVSFIFADLIILPIIVI